MSYPAFLSAVLALLLAPGPTNALMAVGAMQMGLRRVIRLVPFELLGYLTTMLPIVWLGAGTLERSWIIAVALKLAAAAWVMLLAVKLWRPVDPAGDRDEVTGRHIYVTTMLNPKALIAALVLLPAPADPSFPMKLAVFCIAVAFAAMCWATIGRLPKVAGGRYAATARRAASIWLAVVSLTLIATLVRS